ncbi:hypothetical protein DSO57_1002204 [Entomophthora muscae]|uniref:Uncharacterized protein n=1 Tax=Entomophthora muscae TaxID=34485 RepID=A0ACC2U6X5_9FUNG|nr:hypothetical protein DSO57_1002204 [Entomophthora muscae]
MVLTGGLSREYKTKRVEWWMDMKFTTGVLAALAVLCLSGEARQCRNPRPRKEIRELTPNELNRFFRAMKIAHSELRQDRMTHFDYFAYIHTKYQDIAHFEPAFLPWHRFYLREMERKLQSIDPGVMLPYWDWSLDSQAPHESPVLSSRYMGGRGNPNADFCLQDGPFANWTTNFPNRHCLRREYDQGPKVSPLPTPESIILDLNEERFSDFAVQLEIKHGYPHASVGGDAGDLLAMHSPNDPLFYLHHTFIDMLWYQWQQRHPNSNPYDGARYRKPTTLDEILVPFGKTTVRSTLDTRDEAYCYYYPEWPRVIMSPRVPERVRAEINTQTRLNPFLGGNGRQNFLRIFQGAQSFNQISTQGLTVQGLLGRNFHFNLTELLGGGHMLSSPKHLNERFIAMNRLDPEEVEKSEARDSLFLKLLNSDLSFSSLTFSQAIANKFL